MARDTKKQYFAFHHTACNTYPEYFPNHTRTVITSPQHIDQNIRQQPCTITLTTCRHFGTWLYLQKQGSTLRSENIAIITAHLLSGTLYPFQRCLGSLVDHQVCPEDMQLSLVSLVDQQAWKARMDLGHLLRDQNEKKNCSNKYPDNTE